MCFQSFKWLYGQTPQFTISSHANEEDERPRPPLPKNFPPSVRTLVPVIMYFPVADTGDLVPDNTCHVGSRVPQNQGGGN